MGDISEMRGLIFCITFIATAFILVALIPTYIFQTSEAQNRHGVTPSESMPQILSMNATANITLTGTQHDGDNYDIGGWHIAIGEYYPQTLTGGSDTSISGRRLLMEVYDMWYIAKYNREDFIWYDRSGNIASERGTIFTLNPFSQLESHITIGVATVETYNTTTFSTSFEVVSSRCSMSISFESANSTATSILDAYEQGNLMVMFSVDFEERNTQMNAWTFISSILFFTLIPNLEPTVSALIEVPIWVCEGYLIFIFALKIIGAWSAGG